jgi:hypothetical protein
MTGRDANAATALAPPFPIASSAACVDLHWIPLGAGGHSVRFNGIVYEATAAWFQHRPRLEIYHSALEVELAGALYAVEMTPVPNRRGWERGVVAGGAVAAHVAGRFRIFRYEVRRWRDGIIPDLAFAVAGPIRLSDDPRVARRLLALLPVSAHADVGARRAARRRDVELQLDHLVGDHRRRHRHRSDPAPAESPCAGLGRRHHHRSPCSSGRGGRRRTRAARKSPAMTRPPQPGPERTPYLLSQAVADAAVAGDQSSYLVLVLSPSASRRCCVGSPPRAARRRGRAGRVDTSTQGPGRPARAARH